MPANLPGTPALMAIMVGPLLGRLSYEFFPGVISRWLSSAALTWLGICFMGFPLVLSFELLRLLIPLEPFTWGLILAGGLAGDRHGRLRQRPAGHHPGRFRIRIRAERSPAGLRMVQISDVHVGSRSGRFLARVVRKVNALNRT